MVFIFGEKFEMGETHALLSDGLVILAALIWGIQSLYLRQMLKGIDPFHITLWTQAVAIPFFLFFTLLTGFELPDFANRAVLIAVGYNGIIGTGPAMVLRVRLLAGYSPTRVSAFMFLTPVFGVFMGSMILDEPVNEFMMAWAALVAAEIYLVNTASLQRNNTLSSKPEGSIQ